MKHRNRIAGLIAAGMIATTMMVPSASAGPTVLRDDQLRDLAVTPWLGRGYSLATNTFQSICLVDIPKTKASYNFHYKFQQVEKDGTTHANTTFSNDVDVKVPLYGKFHQDSETTVINDKTWHNHSILVNITVDSYYSSVDEAKARISEAARELLSSTPADVPGFFDACGMYYTRSIGRQAVFVALFNYRTESETRDVTFETNLEAEVKGWGATFTAEVGVSGNRRSFYEGKYLTIEASAYGLGKDEKASLISYDLESFKKSIKDAFVSMQGEDTGMVTSIEVVPWVENADFQRILKLQDAKTGTDGKTVISPYAQKRILNENGEFLAEVDRVTRAKLNVYYKAKQCDARVTLDLKTDDKLRPEYAKAKVVNHKTGRQIQLSELMTALDEGKIEDLYTAYKQFLYGGGGGGSSGNGDGAVKCVSDLLATGITTVSHREIDSCKKVEQNFATVSGQLIDEYCLPQVIQ